MTLLSEGMEQPRKEIYAFLERDMLMAKHDKSQHKARFQIGDMVRVRKGIQDPDFPDIPMGGWVGTIKEVESGRRETTYLIKWNHETLTNIHPVYRKRCERDGLDCEETYLSEDDLESYGGEALSIEQPTKINTPELSPKNQDDRVKAILGATGDDPVPDVDTENLVSYWQHLNKHLTIPFEAKHCPEDGPDHAVTVTGLPDPDEYECDEFYGLFCEA